MFRIYSFDIFDTLITRKTATPAGIFLIIQYRLRNTVGNQYPVNLIEDFYQIRIDSENKARAESDYEEITLDEIYKKIQFRFKLTPFQLDTLKKLEIDTELENIIGIQSNISKVIDLLNLGEQVILISDMYLHSGDIKKILKKIEPRLAACPIFVSSEQKVSKRTSNLFKQILKEYNLNASQLFHYGDNKDSDFRIPKKIGINAKLFNYNAISEYEQIYFIEDRLHMQLIAGVSKNTRLELSNQQSVERIGACYSGPLLYAYTEFVLQSAVAQNLEKIYFFSRDGHILFKIARIIREKRNLKINLHYLHVSRQVCYLASLFEITSKECNWIQEFMENINTLANRFSLDSNRLMEMLNQKLREPLLSTSKILTENQKKSICHLIVNDNEMTALFLKQAKKFRDIFLEYMQQNHVFSDIRFAMVDIGWSGKMQDSLYKVLSSQKSQIQMVYFYFGMYNKGYQRFTPYTSKLNQKHCFLESPMQVRTHATFFEVITCTNHGTTLSYEKKENGKIIPILAPYIASKNWDIFTYQNQILHFSEKLSSIEINFSKMRNYAYEIAEELKIQAEKPISEIAEAVGEFPYTMGHDENNIEALAPRISIIQVILWSFNRKLSLSYWIPGSLQRSSFFTRSTFKILEAIRMKGRKLKTFIDNNKFSYRNRLKEFYKYKQ